MANIKGIVIAAAVLGILFTGLSVIGMLKKGASVYDDQPEEKNLSAGPADLSRKSGIYERRIKGVLDKLLSFFALVLLSPVYAVISMRLSAPHDTPTHLLENPEQYITGTGRFLRRSSLDELPQIWDIFIGNMSVIGPRPALWNQEDLIAERDRYGANDIKPGLSGWAQINGRDELAIAVKARLDGEYVEKESFIFDVRCFLGTIRSVLRRDGVLEGGAGGMGEKAGKTAN